jgi:hypothetical protein
LGQEAEPAPLQVHAPPLHEHDPCPYSQVSEPVQVPPVPEPNGGAAGQPGVPHLGLPASGPETGAVICQIPFVHAAIALPPPTPP